MTEYQMVQHQFRAIRSLNSTGPRISYETQPTLSQMNAGQPLLYCVTIPQNCSCVAWPLKKQWRHTHTHTKQQRMQTHTLGTFLSLWAKKGSTEWSERHTAQRASHSPLLPRLKATYHKPHGRSAVQNQNCVFSSDRASQRSTEPVINS